MSEIDKRKLGAFIARLRRENGMTQKELAHRLMITDKAVSKWETGVSMPDTALLIPLSQILKVSVTELLLCEKREHVLPMEEEQVEAVVQTAVQYGDQKPPRCWQQPDQHKWGILCLVALAGGAAGRMALATAGIHSAHLDTVWLLNGLFAVYFCFLVRLRLPRYYDDNVLSFVADGPFRMNVVGLRFSNRNWGSIVKAMRIFLCVSLLILPFAAAAWLCWLTAWAELLLYGVWMAGLFATLLLAGKRRE